jgi:DNA-directed RNA polymerase subunit E'/Rpb7
VQMSRLIERRSVGRTAISKGVLLFSSTQRGVFTGMVVDVTNVGARIRLNGANVLPPNFQLSFDNFQTVRSCRLIWRRDDFVGIAFEN